MWKNLPGKGRGTEKGRYGVCCAGETRLLAALSLTKTLLHTPCHSGRVTDLRAEPWLWQSQPPGLQFSMKWEEGRQTTK